MRIQELDDLLVWFESNVLNAFALNPDLDVIKTPKNTRALSDGALVYKWCPHQKKLVRSRQSS